jgi:hypothetical protein
MQGGGGPPAAAGAVQAAVRAGGLAMDLHQGTVGGISFFFSSPFLMIVECICRLAPNGFMVAPDGAERSKEDGRRPLRGLEAASS